MEEFTRTMKLDGLTYHKLIAIASTLGSTPAGVIEEAAKKGCRNLIFGISAYDGQWGDIQPKKAVHWSAHSKVSDKVTLAAFNELMDMLFDAWAGKGVKRTLIVSPSDEGEMTITLTGERYSLQEGE